MLKPPSLLMQHMLMLTPMPLRGRRNMPTTTNTRPTSSTFRFTDDVPVRDFLSLHLTTKQRQKKKSNHKRRQNDIDVRWSPRAQPAKTNAKTVQSNVLVPASPASREAENESPSETVFLVGAYAKYEWPYVWLRSNHASRRRGGGGRGGKSGGGGGAKAVPGDGVGAGDEDDGGDDDDDDTRDLPLDLTTTQRWKVGKHRVWDVVEELVNMNVFPNPVNPFAVNHSHLRRKPQDERFLATGAMVSFLRDLLAGTGDGADERMGFGRGGGDGAGGGGGGADERAAGKRLAGLSLGGGGGVGKGRFAAAVEADLNQLVATHLAALPGGLVAGAAQC